MALQDAKPRAFFVKNVSKNPASELGALRAGRVDRRCERTTLKKSLESVWSPASEALAYELGRRSLALVSRAVGRTRSLAFHQLSRLEQHTTIKQVTITFSS